MYSVPGKTSARRLWDELLDDVRLHISENKPCKQRYIICNQLGHDSLGYALYKNHLLGDDVREPSKVRAIATGTCFLKALALEDTSTCEDSLQRTQTKIVVRLGGKLLIAEVEKRNNLGRERLGRAESLGEKHDLGNELTIGSSHGHTKKPSEVNNFAIYVKKLSTHGLNNLVKFGGS
jgi:hypothetical protein